MTAPEEKIVVTRDSTVFFPRRKSSRSAWTFHVELFPRKVLILKQAQALHTGWGNDSWS
jgi:hypothetical protein